MSNVDFPAKVNTAVRTACSVFMPVQSFERKLSVEKNVNQFNRYENQQFDDAIWHFFMLLG
jgi:hypothetical protein